MIRTGWQGESLGIRIIQFHAKDPKWVSILQPAGWVESSDSKLGYAKVNSQDSDLGPTEVFDREFYMRLKSKASDMDGSTPLRNFSPDSRHVWPINL